MPGLVTALCHLASLHLVSSATTLAADYDSGWFLAAVGTKYHKQHTLGAQPTFATLWWAPDCTGANMVLMDGIATNGPEVQDGPNVYKSEGAFLMDVTSVDYAISTGNNAAPAGQGAETHWSMTSNSLNCCVRVVMWGGSNSYLPAADYDSGWFSVSTDQTYAMTHGLGSVPILAIIWAASDCSGSNMYLVDSAYSDVGVQGAWLQGVDDNAYSIKTGNTSISIEPVDSTGCLRVLLWGGGASSLPAPDYEHTFNAATGTNYDLTTNLPDQPLLAIMWASTGSTMSSVVMVDSTFVTGVNGGAGPWLQRVESGTARISTGGWSVLSHEGSTQTASAYLRVYLWHVAPALRVDFDSGWFSVAAGTSYQKQHTLGAQPLYAIVWGAKDCSGTNTFLMDGVEADHGGQLFNGGYGSWLFDVTSTNYVIATGFHSAMSGFGPDDHTSFTNNDGSGCVRVVMWGDATFPPADHDTGWFPMGSDEDHAFVTNFGAAPTLKIVWSSADISGSQMSLVDSFIRPNGQSRGAWLQGAVANEYELRGGNLGFLESPSPPEWYRVLTWGGSSTNLVAADFSYGPAVVNKNTNYDVTTGLAGAPLLAAMWVVDNALGDTAVDCTFDTSVGGGFGTWLQRVTSNDVRLSVGVSSAQSDGGLGTTDSTNLRLGLWFVRPTTTTTTPHFEPVPIEYDSGWFEVNIGMQVDMIHNLSGEPEFAIIWGAADCLGTNMYLMDSIVAFHLHNGYGVWLEEVTATTYRISAGAAASQSAWGGRDYHYLWRPDGQGCVRVLMSRTVMPAADYETPWVSVTLGQTTQVQPGVGVPRLATVWSARDCSGSGMALSTVTTLNDDPHGAQLEADNTSIWLKIASAGFVRSHDTGRAVVYGQPGCSKVYVWGNSIPAPHFDTGIFLAKANSNYDYNHNLGQQPTVAAIWLGQTSSTMMLADGDIRVVGDVHYHRGTYLQRITNTSFRIATSVHGVPGALVYDLSNANIAEAYVRVMLWIGAIPTTTTSTTSSSTTHSSSTSTTSSTSASTTLTSSTSSSRTTSSTTSLSSTTTATSSSTSSTTSASTLSTSSTTTATSSSTSSTTSTSTLSTSSATTTTSSTSSSRTTSSTTTITTSSTSTLSTSSTTTTTSSTSSSRTTSSTTTITTSSTITTSTTSSTGTTSTTTSSTMSTSTTTVTGETTVTTTSSSTLSSSTSSTLSSSTSTSSTSSTDSSTTSSTPTSSSTSTASSTTSNTLTSSSTSTGSSTTSSTPTSSSTTSTTSTSSSSNSRSSTSSTSTSVTSTTSTNTTSFTTTTSTTTSPTTTSTTLTRTTTTLTITTTSRTSTSTTIRVYSQAELDAMTQTTTTTKDPLKVAASAMLGAAVEAKQNLVEQLQDSNETTVSVAVPGGIAAVSALDSLLSEALTAFNSGSSTGSGGGDDGADATEESEPPAVKVDLPTLGMEVSLPVDMMVGLLEGLTSASGGSGGDEPVGILLAVTSFNSNASGVGATGGTGGGSVQVPESNTQGQNSNEPIVKVAAAVVIELTDLSGEKIGISGLANPIKFSLQVEFEPGMECAFWDTDKEAWSTEGVSVGTSSVPGESIVCATTHLSLFGAIFRSFVDTFLCSQFTLLSADGVQALLTGAWYKVPSAIMYWCFLGLLLGIFISAVILDCYRHRLYTWREDFFLLPVHHIDMAQREDSDQDEEISQKEAQLHASEIDEEEPEHHGVIFWVCVSVCGTVFSILACLKETVLKDALDEVAANWFEIFGELRTTLESILSGLEIGALSAGRMYQVSHQAMSGLVTTSSQRLTSADMGLSRESVAFVLADEDLSEVLMVRDHAIRDQRKAAERESALRKASEKKEDCGEASSAGDVSTNDNSVCLAEETTETRASVTHEEMGSQRRPDSNSVGMVPSSVSKRPSSCGFTTGPVVIAEASAKGKLDWRRCTNREDAWAALHDEVCEQIHHHVGKHKWSELPGMVLELFLHRNPLGLIFTMDIFMSCKMRALFFILEVMSAVMLNCAFFSASGGVKGRPEPDEDSRCSEENEEDWAYLLGRICAIASCSVVLSGLVPAFLRSFHVRTFKKFECEGCRKWKRQLVVWRVQDCIIWSFGSAVLTFDIFFVALFLANVSQEDQEEFSIASGIVFLQDFILTPTIVAVLMPSLAGLLLGALGHCGKVERSALLRDVHHRLHDGTNLMLPIVQV